MAIGEIDFQDYYSLIQEEIEQKATIKSVWWLSPAKEECSVRWNCSAPIMGKTDHSSPYIINLNYNMNSSQITVDLTNVTDSFTVEAIISIGDRCVRRFQTIPVIVREIRCDAFYYTFGTPPGRLVDYIDNENALNTDILKATSYTGSPVDYLRFTDYPEQKLENYTVRPLLRVHIRILCIICDMLVKYVDLRKNPNSNCNPEQRTGIAF